MKYFQKSLLSTYLISFLYIFLTAKVSFSNNYLGNPDFETRGLLESEEIGLECWHSEFDTTHDSSIKHTGQYSLKISSINRADTIAIYPDPSQPSCVHEFEILEKKKSYVLERFKSMQVKYGGYIKASLSNPSSSIKVVLNVYDDDNYNKSDTTSISYDFNKGGWQLLSDEFLWNSFEDPTPENETYYFRIYLITDSAINPNSIYLDDFFILPNYIPDPDFERYVDGDTSAFHNFLSPGSVYGDPDNPGNYDWIREDINDNKFLRVASDTTHNDQGQTLTGVLGSLRVNPIDAVIPNTEDLWNDVISFSYEIRSGNYNLDNTSVYEPSIHSIFRCRNQNNSNDMTTVYGSSYDYIAPNKSYGWEICSLSINCPSQYPNNNSVRVDFSLNQGKTCFDSTDALDTLYIWDFDNFKLYEAIPVLSEIPVSSIKGSIYPANKWNGEYPGQLSADSVDVEISWRTNYPSHGSYVVFWRTTPAYRDTFYEDLNFISKSNHRVRTKLQIGSTYKMKIITPGQERSYTDTPEITVNTSIIIMPSTSMFTDTIAIHDLPALRKRVLVFGVPINYYTIKNPRKFRVEVHSDESGWSPVTTQVRPLSWWFDHFGLRGTPTSDRAKTRGLKWLLTAFQASSNETYRIKYGATLSESPLPDTSKFIFKYNSTDHFYRAYNYALDNDKTLSFKVKNLQGMTGFLSDLVYGGNTVLVSGDTISSIIKIQGYDPFKGKVDEIKLVDNGELFGRLEAKLKHEFGATILYSIVSICVFKDLPYFTIDYKVLYESPYQSRQTIPIEKVSINIPINVSNSSSLHYIFGNRDNGSYSGSLDNSEYYIFQNGDATFRLIPGQTDKYKGVTYTFNYDIIKSPEDTIQSGEIATGWMGLYDTAASGNILPYQLFTGFGDFWNQFPTELGINRLSSSQADMNIEFYPDEASDLALCRGSRISWFNTFLYFQPNSSTTVHFENDSMSVFNDPPFALLSPEYYDNSGVLGSVIAESSIDSIRLSKLMSYYDSVFVIGTQFGYYVTVPDTGMLTAPFDSTWNKNGYGAERWSEYLITDRSPHITSNEYEFGGTFFNLAYLDNSQNGIINKEYFHHGIDEARFYIDHISHQVSYDLVRQYNWEVLLPSGLPHKHGTEVHSEKYHAGHCYGIPLLYRYYSQTGEPDALNTLKSFADAISILAGEDRLNIQQFQMASEGVERTLGWPLLTLVEAYNATGDPYYIGTARNLAKKALSFQDTIGWNFSHKIAKGSFPHRLYNLKNTCYACDSLGAVTFTTAILNHSLAKYHEATGDNSISRNLFWVNDFLRNMYDNSNHGFYSDTYNTSLGKVSVTNILTAPSIRYYGKRFSDNTFKTFADSIVDAYNNYINWINYLKQPTSDDELKKAGQISGTMIDMMDHFEDEN